MERIIWNVILLLNLGLGLQSCTSSLLINKSLPPAVQVADEQWKVVVVYRYNPAFISYKRDKKIDVIVQGADNAFAGVLDAINHDDTYSLVAIIDSSFTSPAPGMKLTSEEVASIYRQYPHHLLLSFDQFDAHFDQETIREEDKEGNVSKTANYTLITQSYWTLYDSTGIVLDEINIEKIQPYQSRSVLSGLLAVGPSMGKAGNEVNSLAWETGLDYWKRLSPHYYSIIRMYYTANALKPAADSISAKQWDQAIALLLPIAESDKKRDAVKAAYNLAVVNEAKGDITEAKKWARIAASKGELLAIELLLNLQNPLN